MGMHTKSGKPRVNDASLCRLKGWVVGDVIKITPSVETAMVYGSDIGRLMLSHPERFTEYWRITAIGEVSILVRPRSGGTEKQWSKKLMSWSIEKVNSTPEA